MKHTQRQTQLYLLAATWVVLIGCASPKVMLPPRVDLAPYGKVGMIEVSASANTDLSGFATQKLLQAIHSAQPGARILELGEEESVLRSIGREELDFEAIQAIGERYGVDAVLVGHLEVRDKQPKVSLSMLMKSMSARVDVEASLSAKLLETKTGSTLWTNSVYDRETVAHLELGRRGPADFGAGDPENAYGMLVQTLAHRVTDDFRPHYARR